MKLPWFLTGCTSSDIDQDGRDDQIPDSVPMTLFSQPRPVLPLSLETSIRQTMPATTRSMSRESDSNSCLSTGGLLVQQHCTPYE